MAEDWNSVASEVSEAIAGIGQTSEGHFCTLRVQKPPASDFDNPSDDFEYTTLKVLENQSKFFDAGTGEENISRKLMIGTEAGVVPSKDDKIVIGLRSEDVTPETVFEEIRSVTRYQPGGITLYYLVFLEA